MPQPRAEVSDKSPPPGPTRGQMPDMSNAGSWGISMLGIG